jgi:hypothetical protein
VIGAKVTLPATARPEFALFGESPSRILVSTFDPKQICDIASRHGIESPVIGVTIGLRLQVGSGDQMLIDAEVADLKSVCESAFPGLFNV